MTILEIDPCPQVDMSSVSVKQGTDNTVLIVSPELVGDLKIDPDMHVTTLVLTRCSSEGLAHCIATLTTKLSIKNSLKH